MFAGTYSSIFIAVPLVVAWFERDLLGLRQRALSVAAAGR
jgi:preprotein translocase subunit SecF